jgi:hypothetical protein
MAFARNPTGREPVKKTTAPVLHELPELPAFLGEGSFGCVVESKAANVCASVPYGVPARVAFKIPSCAKDRLDKCESDVLQQILDEKKAVNKLRDIDPEGTFSLKMFKCKPARGILKTAADVCARNTSISLNTKAAKVSSTLRKAYAASADAKMFVTSIGVDGTRAGLNKLQRNRGTMIRIEELLLAARALLFDAIDGLSSKNLVHMDIKPENTLLVQDGKLLRIVLIDFDFMKTTDELIAEMKRTLVRGIFDKVYKYDYIYFAPELYMWQYNRERGTFEPCFNEENMQAKWAGANPPYVDYRDKLYIFYSFSPYSILKSRLSNQFEAATLEECNNALDDAFYQTEYKDGKIVPTAEPRLLDTYFEIARDPATSMETMFDAYAINAFGIGVTLALIISDYCILNRDVITDTDRGRCTYMFEHVLLPLLHPLPAVRKQNITAARRAFKELEAVILEEERAARLEAARAAQSKAESLKAVQLQATANKMEAERLLELQEKARLKAMRILEDPPSSVRKQTRK